MASTPGARKDFVARFAKLEEQVRLERLRNPQGVEVDAYTRRRQPGDTSANSPSPVVSQAKTLGFKAGGFLVDSDASGNVSVSAGRQTFFMPYAANDLGFLPRPPMENSNGGITYAATGIFDPATAYRGGGTSDQTLTVHANDGDPFYPDQPLGAYFHVARMTTGVVTVNGAAGAAAQTAPRFLLPGSLTPVSSFTLAQVGDVLTVQKVDEPSTGGDLWLVSGAAAPAAGGGAAVPVGAWTLLYPYLTAGWRGAVNNSTQSLTDLQAPRYYIDRERVYFAGTVLFLTSLNGANAPERILSGLPAALTPPVYDHNFQLHENGRYTNANVWTRDGWLYNFNDSARLEIRFNSGETTVPNNLSISLDQISYRVT